MSSQPSATYPVIELRPSAGLAVFVVIVHAGGAVCLWFTPLPVWAVIIFGILLLVGATYNLWRYALLAAPRSIHKLQRRGDEWQITRVDGAQFHAALTPASTHSHLFSALNFRNERRRIIVPLCPDMCSADDYRRIRQYLTVRSGKELSADWRR